jgi:hypothetical protein
MVLLLVATSAAAQAPQPRVERLVVRVGDQQTLSAAGVASYSMTGPVADVRVTADGATFVIVGAQPGVTVLLLIETDGTQRRIEVEVVPLPTASQVITVAPSASSS